MKKLLFILTTAGLGLILASLALARVSDLYIKTGDRLPYYTFQVVDSDGDAVDISATTITARVENISTGDEVVTDESVDITNGAAGYAELRWPDASTNTAGTYAIEFKIISGGLQYTLPASFSAIVKIKDRY
jgi:hypothetical protein